MRSRVFHQHPLRGRQAWLLAVSLLFVAGVALGQVPYKVQFGFERSSGDRDYYFGERHSETVDSFDVNGSQNWQVTSGKYVNHQRMYPTWMILNDVNPDVQDAAPATNVTDLITQDPLVVRSEIDYLYSGGGTLDPAEGASVGILFGLTGTGADRSGYIARVERVGSSSLTANQGYLYIDEFTNGVRGASLVTSAEFLYGRNSDDNFLELKIDNIDGTIVATISFWLEALISPDVDKDPDALTSPAFDTVPPTMSTNVALPGYTAGFLGLYGEDNSNKNPENPANPVLRVGTFYAKSGSAPDVALEVTDTLASEDGDTGAYEFFRSVDGTNEPITLFYEVSGTASNGVDYPLLPGSIVIPAGETNVTLTITPIDDSESELVETLTLTLTASTNYLITGGTGGTVSILDNDPTKIGIVASDTNAYERLPGCVAEFTLIRYGLTNSSPSVSLSYSGTAANSVDYTASTSAFLASGQITASVSVTPIDNSVYAGNKTVVATVVAGTGYSPAPDDTDSAIIVDDELPDEIVLWSDDFDSGADNATNYIVLAAALDGTNDFSANWYFDYLGVGGIPQPPFGSMNYGLQMSANKDLIGSPAAVNVYPIGQEFGGDYALRFHLLLRYDLTDAEEVIFGINQSGSATNWTKGSFGTETFGEGVWAALRTGHPSPPTTSAWMYSPITAGGPADFVAGAGSAQLEQILHSPPLGLPGYVGSSVFVGPAAGTMTWVDVELAQVGALVTLSVNNTPILTHTNEFGGDGGNIFLGYNDAFLSIGQPETYAIIDNVRVVNLGLNITAISVSGGTVEVEFIGAGEDTPGGLSLQSAATVDGPYADDGGAVITSLGAGLFRATTTTSGDEQYYRIKRL